MPDGEDADLYDLLDMVRLAMLRFDRQPEARAVAEVMRRLRAGWVPRDECRREAFEEAESKANEVLATYDGDYASARDPAWGSEDYWDGAAEAAEKIAVSIRALAADTTPTGSAPPGWRPIETAPHGDDVLLYCPDRGDTNRSRIEVGPASQGWRNEAVSNMSYHPWASHWMPLPPPPADTTLQEDER